jgi:glycosyltransferase involved in cell wall biosynthesis
METLPEPMPSRQIIPKVTALICTLNEQETLPYVLRRIPEWVDEVLLVDGHSTDQTVEVARSLRPDVRVEYQPGTGKGDAVRCGIAHSAGDIIVTLDADGETDPEEMKRFIEPLMHGYDFVKGSRFYPGFFPKRAFHRSLGNLILAVAFDLLFLQPFTDICSGYNAFWKKSIMKVNLDREGDFAAEPTLLARARKSRLRIKEVGHRNRGRLGGVAKVPVWWRHGLWVLTTIVRERFCA